MSALRSPRGATTSDEPSKPGKSASIIGARLGQTGPASFFCSRLLAAVWKPGTRGGRFYSQKSIRETAWWHADSSAARHKNRRWAEKCVRLARTQDSGSDSEISLTGELLLQLQPGLNEPCLTSNRCKLTSCYSGWVLAWLLQRQRRSLMMPLISPPPPPTHPTFTTRYRIISLNKNPTICLRREY